MALALCLMTATTAAAHECYNASRSDQGNLKAGSNSKAWVTFAVADIIASEVEEGDYDADTGECILDEYEAAGAPASFTVKIIGGKNGLIAGGVTRQDLLSNGKGIDHISAAYGQAITEAYEACGAEF